MDTKLVEQIYKSLIDRAGRIEKSVLRDNDAEEMNLSQAEIIDIAQSLEQLGRDTTLAEKERAELIAIERALAKMATGNFGVCEDCGEDIPTKRLVVLPEARLCAVCQSYEERQNSRIRSPNIIAR